MFSNLRDFWAQRGEGGGPLFGVGLILLVLAIWLMIEGAAALMRFRKRPPLETMRVIYSDDA
jgi:hypothetical protein